MNSALLTAVITLLVFRCGVTSPINNSPTSCEEDVHDLCGTKAFHEEIGDDSFLFLNEESLVRHCSDIIEDIECKKNFLSRCDPDGADAFSLATDGMKDVLADLCNNNTDLRKAYHSHSPCISSASADYEDCLLNSVDGTTYDYDSEGNDVTPNDAIIQRLCRFYDPFKFCVTQATRRMCGDSAAQFVDQVIIRLALPAVSAKCPRNSNEIR